MLWARLQRWFHCLIRFHRPLTMTDQINGITWVGCDECDRYWR